MRYRVILVECKGIIIRVILSYNEIKFQKDLTVIHLLNDFYLQNRPGYMELKRKKH